MARPLRRRSPKWQSLWPGIKPSAIRKRNNRGRRKAAFNFVVEVRYTPPSVYLWDRDCATRQVRIILGGLVCVSFPSLSTPVSCRTSRQVLLAELRPLTNVVRGALLHQREK